MLDIEILRQKPDLVKEAVALKNGDPARVDAFVSLDVEWRKLTAELEEKRREQKELSKNRDIEAARKNKEAMKTLEDRIRELEIERELIWIQIPNIPFDDVPRGRDESGNVPVRTWGEPRKFSFAPKEHLALGEALGVIDVEKASVVSGARFAYLKGDAALLQFALISYVFATLTDPKIIKKIANGIEEGYPATPFIPVVPPVMIRPEVFRRMARLDPGQEEERYYLSKDDLYLVGSAEHTLGPLHMDETIPEGRFPLRYVGYSTAFRREAGSYGKDMKGILRVHQFDKIEMESFTTPEHSRKEQDFIVAIQEYLMQSLEIPYRVVAVCTGDMGGPDARQIDIEAWLPGQNKYRETHTSDLMTDYQSRRLRTKVKRTDGKTELAHMNDATAFAIGRILITIMENYQEEDGSVRIPKVLQSYVGKKTIAPPDLD